MFYLIYFLLKVVALTAVWAKGGNFTVSVCIMAGQSNLVSAHNNKEKNWKHTHRLQGFSGSWLYSSVAAAKASWHAHVGSHVGSSSPRQRKSNLRFPDSNTKQSMCLSAAILY